MAEIFIRPYSSADEAGVIALWHECGLVTPQNDPRADIGRKLTEHPELFLVAHAPDGALFGTCMAGYEGHRGWINYLAVAPSHRGGGLGRRLMDEAEVRLRALGCPKINLQVRTNNRAVLDFYLRLGFREDAVVSLGKRLTPPA